MTNKFPEMMENFDIENLERKNIYRTPDFFAEMQESVLQKTIYSIQPVTKVENSDQKKSNNWLYAVAAAVALLFGITMFWMNSKNESQPKTEITKAETNKPQYKPRVEQLPVSPTVDTQQAPTQTFAIAESQKYEAPKPAKATVAHNTISQQSQTSDKNLAKNDIDKIVNSLPEKDLAEISNDADTDVYLDLYN